ncbi:MAG: hypothetical protein JWL62_1975, partial [Hyphomicrobiales bacterium]|nr:hypothetical protein [Hyphomicrobiales bacterium]
MKKAGFIIGTFTLAALGMGVAQAQSMNHEMHGSMPAQSPSSEAFAKVNDKMHKDMSIPLTGNA